MLRERWPASLLIMQDDEIDVEGNMRASGKIKMVDDTKYKYKGKSERGSRNISINKRFSRRKD